MFERYTERARRVIFFARYEASQFGANEIGDVHLLLGLMREDSGLVHRLLSMAKQSDRQQTIEGLRSKVEEQIGPPRPGVSTSVDMPLNSHSKRILAYAAEEADLMQQRQIGSGHLLLGILRESGCLAASLLKQEGIELAPARQAIGPALEAEADTGHPGRIVSSLARIAVLEFVSEGNRIVASVSALATTVVPRSGERVIIRGKQGEERTYTVEDVSYIYEPYPPDMAVAPHRLAKVVVRLRGRE